MYFPPQSDLDPLTVGFNLLPVVLGASIGGVVLVLLAVVMVVAVVMYWKRSVD